MAQRIGVTVGKFNPPHLGHLLLIETAAKSVDHLYVLLGDRSDQTIPARDRARWLRAVTSENVTVITTIDDLPAANEPWASRALAELPEQPDVAFTSEGYGEGWAAAMGIEHIGIDVARETVPMSGTELRADLRSNFDFLIPPARADLAKRVVIAGAESTGKTTLAKEIASHYSTVWVPEYGRAYWEARRHLTTPWSASDFIEIATRHHALTDDLASHASSGLVISDTDALVTSVWMRRYLGSTSDALELIAAQNRPDLYLITEPDFAWVQDGTRESQTFRRRMHEWTQESVQASGVATRIVSGKPGDRLEQAIAAIEPHLAFSRLV